MVDTLPRLNFSVRHMLWIIGAIAIGCTLLVYAERDKISGGILAFAVFSLLISSAIGAVCGQGRKRAKCVGFFIGCFSYLLLIGYIVETRNRIAPNQVTIRFLEQLHPYFQRRRIPDPRYQDYLDRGIPSQDLNSRGIFPTKRAPAKNDFLWVGQILIALVFGYVGSIIGVRSVEHVPRKSTNPKDT